MKGGTLLATDRRGRGLLRRPRMSRRRASTAALSRSEGGLTGDGDDEVPSAARANAQRASSRRTDTRAPASGMVSDAPEW